MSRPIVRGMPATWSDQNVVSRICDCSIVGVTVPNAKTLNPFIYVTVYFHEYSQRSALTDWRPYHLPSQWAALYATIAKRFVYSRPTPLSPIDGAPTYRSDFTVGTSPAVPSALSPLVHTATPSLALVPTAPSHFFRQHSTRPSDITTARVPDAQEFTMGGLSGALPPMNIRGHYSYTVDGIRDNNTTRNTKPLCVDRVWYRCDQWRHLSNYKPWSHGWSELEFLHRWRAGAH
jgi:hypothetical protein